MGISATFDGLDLNSQRDRETVYFERVQAEFLGEPDDVVYAAAKALSPYLKTYDWRGGALRDIAEHRIALARQVEPKMESFRKVRAGWYSLTIVSLDEALADYAKPAHERRYEEYVDVSREKNGDMWVVSTRGGKSGYDRNDTSTLNQNSLFSNRFGTITQARRYAVALKAYLLGKGPHPDWLQKVFSDEDRAAFEARMERITGKPYAEWLAEQGL